MQTIISDVPGQGKIVKEQFVGSYVGKTIADLVADGEAGALYVNLHNRLNPSVSSMASSTTSHSASFRPTCLPRPWVTGNTNFYAFSSIMDFSTYYHTFHYISSPYNGVSCHTIF
jgi:hypothetical protein